jgi:hypothetical protein
MTPTAPRLTSLRLAQRGIVLLLCLSLGLHWALLQGIAWTGMILSFAREGTVIEAVQKTFDGQHACALCTKVKEGQTSDQNQPTHSGQTLKKIDAVLVEVTRLIAPAGEVISFVVLHEVMMKRTETPEPPPPRRGLV